MGDCSICCDTLNKTIRKRVACPYCQFICCLQCFRRYLMGSVKMDCMSCHHELSIGFVYNKTPRTFYNKEYRKKRVEHEFESQKSMLPQTQPAVKQELRCRELEKEISRIRTDIGKLHQQLNDQNFNFREHINNGTIIAPQTLSRIIKERRLQITVIQDEIIRLRKYPNQPETMSFIMPCSSDGCCGFLSDSTSGDSLSDSLASESEGYECGLCTKITCRECHRVRTEGHVCNQDDVKSVKAIQIETKPCPTCGTRIFKSSGCYQMFCTKCHCVFCWRTGEIDRGPVHNPHYYEWRRKNREDVKECAEGGLPSVNDVERVINRIYLLSSNWENPYMLVNHIRGVTLTETYPAPGDDPNRDLRIKLLLKEVGEDQFKRELMIRMKRREKNGEIRMVMEMLSDTISDTFNSFVTYDDVDLLGELEELRNYVNTELGLIKKRYGGKHISAPYVSPKWYLIHEKNLSKYTCHHFY